MGKQRALKNKDVVPAVKIDAARPKKHKKFDDSDDNQSEHEEFYPNSATTSQSAIEDDDNAPEEVVQDEIQIRALKEEVENLFAVQIGAKRKRKFTREAVAQKEEEDSETEYLDEKDLKVVSYSRREAKDLSAIDTSNSSDSENADSGRDRMGLKRKIGNLEVAVISNASIDDFRLNSDAEQFLNQHRAKVQRTRYTSFMSQRRPAPAKKFSSKRKGK